MNLNLQEGIIVVTNAAVGAAIPSFDFGGCYEIAS
jgi:hypothetical protein